MRTGRRPVSGGTMAVRAAVVAAAVFTLWPLAAFVLSALEGGGSGGQGPGRASIIALFSPATLAALRFSLRQAALSTILAFVVGFPGAYFVAKYEFKGRRFFLALAAVPFCLPSILVILSFILYYGKSGWFSLALAKAGLAPGGGSLLYSLWGLVFVHAFYNFPIFIQNVGSVWSKMPRSREEAARTLGAGRLRSFTVGTLPYLLPSVLQAASLVFLFCFFSFTIVLVFGSLAGTTLEVGIYRAIRFTNDRPQALALALVQTIVALLAVAAFAHFDKKTGASAQGFGGAPPRRQPRLAAAIGIGAYLFCILIFFLGPLLALLVEAFTVQASLAAGRTFGLGNFTRLLGGSGGSRPTLVAATLNSLALSGSAAIGATIFGLILAASSHYSQGSHRSRLGGWMTALPLALSPALIASGWSALMSQGGAFLIILAQTSIAWPFVA
ncbi:MAG: ABC transporter permease subunit, partial [Rectinemataceae bacterium]|nr:ABC transporter permease subunit [Rectinemataceae bacterium]